MKFISLERQFIRFLNDTFTTNWDTFVNLNDDEKIDLRFGICNPMGIIQLQSDYYNFSCTLKTALLNVTSNVKTFLFPFCINFCDVDGEESLI